MPVWEAQYVIVISSRTGWSEQYIRHELPLSRGFAYFHTCRLMEGERCRWPNTPSALGTHIHNVMHWAKSLWKSTTKS